MSALTVGVVSLLTALPAHATPQSGVVVASAGSDTTEKVMNTIMNHYNGLNSGAGPLVIVGGVSQNAHTFNIPTTPTAFVVPGESTTATDCPSDIAWSTGTTLNRGIAPNGSGAGLNYLKAENGGTGPNPVAGTETSGQNFGCVDIARSSGGPRGLANDPASFEYYAFALDAVSWATTSMKAPPFLTTAQLQGIYKCQFTDWSQVGGAPGPIQRYLPNPNSGTRKFFISDVLQLTSYTAADEAAGTNCPAVKGDGTAGSTIIEENQAATISDVDVDKAILPFSAGQWAFQHKNHINPTLDFRREARIGGILTAPTSGSPVNNTPIFWNTLNTAYELNTPEANTGAVGGPGVVAEANVKAESGGTEASGLFPGIRFVYNVLDNNGNRRGYQAAIALVGFDNSGAPTPLKSPLCSGTGFEKAAVQSAGFAPLNTTGGGSHNTAGAACRLLTN